MCAVLLGLLAGCDADWAEEVQEEPVGHGLVDGEARGSGRMQVSSSNLMLAGLHEARSPGVEDFGWSSLEGS